MTYKKLASFVFVLICSLSALFKNLEQVKSSNYFDSSTIFIVETLSKKQGNQIEVDRILDQFNSIQYSIITPELNIENKENISNKINKQETERIIEQSKLDSFNSTKGEKPLNVEVKKQIRKKKKKIKRRSAKDLYNIYNDMLYKTETKIKTKKKYKPTVWFSKNYWMFRLFPDKVLNMAEESENSEQYFEDFQKQYLTTQELNNKEKSNLKRQIESGTLKIKSDATRKRIFRKRDKYLNRFGLQHDYDYETLPFVELVYPESEMEMKAKPPESTTQWEVVDATKHSYKQYYRFSWNNLVKYGPTLKEVEKGIAIVSLIRFFVYAKRYNLKAALRISFIGWFSASAYMYLLSDVIGYGHWNMIQYPKFFRAAFEGLLAHRRTTDYEYFNGIRPVPKHRAKFWGFSLLRMSETQLVQIGMGIDNYLRDHNFNNLADKLTSLYNTLNPLGSKIRELIKISYFLVVRIFKKIKKFSGDLLTFLLPVYTLFLRLGKNIVPYAMQWHVMVNVIVIMTFFIPIKIYYNRSIQFEYNVLIPEHRITEVAMMISLHAILLSGAVYMLSLAMLHALFSQYYFIPFLVPSVEAHVGKRPKDSIYSGGYTSWQDEIDLFTPSKNDFKLWFGWLGKGPNDKKRRKRRRRNRKNPE